MRVVGFYFASGPDILEYEASQDMSLVGYLSTWTGVISHEPDLTYGIFQATPRGVAEGFRIPLLASSPTSTVLGFPMDFLFLKGQKIYVSIAGSAGAQQIYLFFAELILADRSI